MADIAFWEEKADLALRMIREKGQELQWRRKGASGTYDPIEDVEIPGSDLVQPVFCIILPASKGTIEAFDNRLVAGTLIEQNLRFMKMAAKGLLFEPMAGDITEFEGSRWKALGSTPVNPAGVPVVYNVAIQRA